MRGRWEWTAELVATVKTNDAAMKHYLWDAPLILAIMVWVLGLTFQRTLEPQAAALVLFGLVALSAIGRVIGSGLVRLAFRLALPVASFLVFAAVYGGDSLLPLGGAMATLFVILTGIYVMLGGGLSRGSRR